TTPARAATEGCIASAGSSCVYSATKNGGIVASGTTWRVMVQHGRRSTTYGPAYYLDAPKHSSRRVNAIRKGDVVYVWTGPTASYISGGCCVSWPPVVDVVAVGPDYNH
ncbi:MAG: hypothetical protein QOC92_3310, partial [Acidimicrobiaceae bacterium]